MKQFKAMFYLITKEGSRISVMAPNRVEAFEKMHFLFPDETEGYSFRNVKQF